MTWNRNSSPSQTLAARTTKHTCGGPVFGRKTPGCPRCDEMLNGAPAVKWDVSWRKENERREALYSLQHRIECPICSGRTGGVCTWGEW